MRRIPFVSAVAAAVAVAALLVAPLEVRAQEAATITEVGWWSQNPTTAPPAGGFQVAQAPNGDVSIAAVRISVASPSLTAARLLLQESQVVGTATLQVCRTTSAWSASEHGFDDRPEVDCGAPVALQRNEASREWAADVLALVSSGGDVSLVVVPAPDPANPTPLKTPFQADFTGATIVASGADPTTESAGGGAGGGLASGDLGSLPSDTGLSVAPTSPVDEFAISPVGAPPDLNPAAAPAAAAPPQVPGRFPVRSSATGGGGSDTPWGRLPLVILAAGLFGAATAFARQRLQTAGWLPSG